MYCANSNNKVIQAHDKVASESGSLIAIGLTIGFLEKARKSNIQK